MTKSKSKPAADASGESTNAAAPSATRPKGKIGAVIALLRRPEGAGLVELQTATGWQAHSVRGAIAGAIKKKHGLTVTSEKTDGGRIYRIPEGAGA